MSKIVVLILVAVLLIACGSRTTASSQVAGGSTTPQANNNLTRFQELAVGTFELEDTPQAVTAEQAATLLPLWKAYKSLSGSASSSPEELAGLQKQIEKAMTAEQIQAIANMQVSRDTLLAVMQERGLTTTATARGAAGSASGANQVRQGQGPGFGGNMPIPGGMPPQGAQGFPGAGGPAANPQELQTRQAQRASAGTDLFTAPLVEELIRLLESKRA